MELVSAMLNDTPNDANQNAANKKSSTNPPTGSRQPLDDLQNCNIEGISKMSNFCLKNEIEVVIRQEEEAFNFVRSLATYLSFVCKNMIGNVKDPVELRNSELKRIIQRFRNIDHKKQDSTYFLKLFKSLVLKS